MVSARVETSSTQQAIPLRKRLDLSFTAVVNRGEPQWIVKDPIALQYHVLNEQEAMVLQALAQDQTFQQLRALFERQFSPHRVTYRELQNFLLSLHEKSLLIATSGDQGRFLSEISKQKRRSESLRSLQQITYWKFRGINPQWLLDRYGGLFQWIFAPITICIVCGYLALAVLGALVFAREIASKLPEVNVFFAGENGLRLLLTLSFVKVLHEFGHAMAFRRFGGRCHEIGILVMFLIPTLYCNTTDSWMLKSKWQRMAVGLGGIYVEVILLCIASTIWLLTHSNDLQLWALQFMLVCSVSTILVNGNPLIKYDGYYVLSDYLEIPNLAQRSSRVVKQAVLRLIWGAAAERDDWTPRSLQIWLGLYAVSAFLFRLLLLAGISLILFEFLNPYGLGPLATVLTVFAVTSVVLRPLVSVIRATTRPGSSLTMNHRRGTFCTLALVTLLAIAFSMPFPYEISAPYELGMQDMRQVYCSEPGILDQILVQEGDIVTSGQLLAVLTNIDLTTEKLLTESSLAAATEEFRLRLRSNTNLDLDRTEPLRQRITMLEQRLGLLDERIANLSIRSPISGKFYRTTSRPLEPQSDAGLSSWSGQPLHQANLGTYLEVGTRLGMVASEGTKLARIKVPQRDIGLIQQGAQTRLMQASYVHESLEGIVVETSATDAKVNELPANLSVDESKRAGGSTGYDATAQHDDFGNLPIVKATHLEDRFYMVTVSLSNQSALAVQRAIPGDSGTAKIAVGNRSLAWRFTRWLLNTFSSRV